MIRILLLFLLINLILCSCTVFQPLKRVQYVDSTNNMVRKYAGNFKYLGKVVVNFPNNLSESQKKYVYYKLEPHMAYYGFKSQRLTTSYKDYQLDEESFREYIQNKVFSNPKSIDERNIYLDLFSNTNEKIYSHIFYIGRQSHGLVTNDLFICLIEMNSQIKLIFFADMRRSELKANIKTKLFVVPFHSHKYVISKNIEDFLEVYLKAEINAKKNNSKKTNLDRFLEVCRRFNLHEMLGEPIQ